MRGGNSVLYKSAVLEERNYDRKVRGREAIFQRSSDIDLKDMTHIYNGQAAKRLVQTILTEYSPVFQCMRERLLRYYGGNLEDI